MIVALPQSASRFFFLPYLLLLLKVKTKSPCYSETGFVCKLKLRTNRSLGTVGKLGQWRFPAEKIPRHIMTLPTRSNLLAIFCKVKGWRLSDSSRNISKTFKAVSLMIILLQKIFYQSHDNTIDVIFFEHRDIVFCRKKKSYWNTNLVNGIPFCRGKVIDKNQ